MSALLRICEYLSCNIGDVCAVILTEKRQMSKGEEYGSR